MPRSAKRHSTKKNTRPRVKRGRSRKSKIVVPKRRIQQTSKTFPILLIVLGLLMVGISLLHWVFKFRALRLSNDVVAQYEQQSDPRDSTRPRHIFIRWFLDTGIEDAAYTSAGWSIAPTKATYLLQSARPGEAGNIIIYGHNTREILGNIRALKGGETITLTLEDGTTKLYIVDSLYEVPPSDVRFIEPTTTEVLTLYTCSGLLDSQRFIVRATPQQ